MIIFYPGVGGVFTTNLIDAATNTVIDSGKKCYAEYTLKVTAQIGTLSGARRSTLVTFGTTGTTQDACDLQAGLIAELIQDLSAGTITQFYKKLGSYCSNPNVDNMTPVPAGSTKYGILNWTNSGIEGGTPLQVNDAGGGQVIFPFTSFDAIADQMTNIMGFVTGSNLAKAKFTPGANNASFTVYLSKNKLGITVKEFNGLQAPVSSRTDPDSGISDGVLARQD